MSVQVVILRRDQIGSGFRWHGKVNGHPVSVDSTVVDFETRSDRSTEEVIQRAMVNAVRYELSQRGVEL